MQRTANRATKVIFLCLTFFCFFSCAPKVDVIQTGPWTTPSKKWKEIPVFSSREEIKKTWIAVALFHGKSILAVKRNKIEAQVKKARKIASKIGADAVLLVEARDETSTKRMVYISGVAIKYVNEKKSLPK